MADQHPLWRKRYLSAYNVVQGGLWATLLVLTLLHLANGPVLIYTYLEPFSRWTQTFALLDVLHAATQLIPSNTATTFTQVVTRVIQVWAIWWAFPEAILGDDSQSMNAKYGWNGSSSGSIAFVALLLAWSLADAIRYTYLLCKMHGMEGRVLTWTRCENLFSAWYLRTYTHVKQIHDVLRSLSDRYLRRMVAHVLLDPTGGPCHYVVAPAFLLSTRTIRPRSARTQQTDDERCFADSR